MKQNKEKGETRVIVGWECEGQYDWLRVRGSANGSTLVLDNHSTTPLSRWLNEVNNLIITKFWFVCGIRDLLLERRKRRTKA